MQKQHAIEVSEGERFEFGKNWNAFLQTLNSDRIAEAEKSLCQMLGVESLAGKKFLDIGSGSGIFSLAARRLGASVHSFDYDPKSVACAVELKKRYFDRDPNWVIAEGSVLDDNYVGSLGEFDVVYSWGVLHHTGNLAKALHNALIPVAPSGMLFIAIYNDQGLLSRAWAVVKRVYCSGVMGKVLVTAGFVPFFAVGSLLSGLVRHGDIMHAFSQYKQRRGMSVYHDWLDWLGGYPFEVAKPEDILNVFRRQGFVLENLVTTNRLGCNQFVFRKGGMASVSVDAAG
jgi:2-polyprenyl-3-methyl-5-hydroxy-6-metoxy-1,4-benzoquinol methylase